MGGKNQYQPNDEQQDFETDDRVNQGVLQAAAEAEAVRELQHGKSCWNQKRKAREDQAFSETRPLLVPSRCIHLDARVNVPGEAHVVPTETFERGQASEFVDQCDLERVELRSVRHEVVVDDFKGVGEHVASSEILSLECGKEIEFRFDVTKQ